MYICANAPIVTAVIAHAITVNVARPREERAPRSDRPDFRGGNDRGERRERY